MIVRTCLLLLCFAGAAAPCCATELRIYPAEIPLTGPRSGQQLLVVEDEAGRTIADRTAGARFVSADPKIAIVDEAGLVTPKGDGETTISATANGKSATARVRVTKVKDPAPPSFRNDVL